MRLLQYDAFTRHAFSGNPAAVCLTDGSLPESWMQSVAREMNLSETAFLARKDGSHGEARFDLRWFTPEVEVDLCGHATLASAAALWDEGEAARGEVIYFDTRSGELTARFEDGMIWLDFPSTPPLASPVPDALARALGAEVVWSGFNDVDWFAVLESTDAVRALRPNLGGLGEVQMRGVIVTAREDGREADFVSRFFAPGAGVDEDPVTGSAHCSLAPYWAGQTGRDNLTGYQASARGGEVRVRVRGERVHLGGHAVRTAEITLAEAALASASLGA